MKYHNKNIMFRQKFTEMQFMMNLHAIAIKQNATNDWLRDIYNKFLWEELDVLNDFMKYGKLKGFLRRVLCIGPKIICSNIWTKSL